MKQDQITAAYKGLNADQMAALAFHYLSEENNLEFKRLGDAVPLSDYRYRGPDEAYQARLDGVRRFAEGWATEYWRLRCYKAEMLGATLAAVRRGVDDEKADALLDAHGQAESYLLALDVAMTEVCDDHGIDPADVRRMSGAEAFKPRREGTTPDADYLAAMRAGLAKLAALPPAIAGEVSPSEASYRSTGPVRGG